MLAKIIASLLLVANAIFLSNLVNNFIFDISFWILSGVTIFYLFQDKSENNSNDEKH
mgnify:CR=1 FL=1